MKSLEQLFNSLPEVYYSSELPYWLTITKVLKIWQISYVGDRLGNYQEILFTSRNRDINKCVKEVLKRIKKYENIT